MPSAFFMRISLGAPSITPFSVSALNSRQRTFSPSKPSVHSSPPGALPAVISPVTFPDMSSLVFSSPLTIERSTPATLPPSFHEVLPSALAFGSFISHARIPRPPQPSALIGSRRITPSEYSAFVLNLLRRSLRNCPEGMLKSALTTGEESGPEALQLPEAMPSISRALSAGIS